MRFDEYQKKSKRTMAPVSTDFQHAIYAMGLGGEAGEVVDYLKKVLGHGHTVDLDVLAKELGDVLFYVAALCESYGLSMGDVAAGNVKKLLERYPDGFSSEASINRGAS